MAVSDAQKRANEKYRKENVKQISVRFYPSEYEVYEFLKSQDNTAGFIKQLVKDAMQESNTVL